MLAMHARTINRIRRKTALNFGCKTIALCTYGSFSQRLEPNRALGLKTSMAIRQRNRNIYIYIEYVRKV